LAPLNAVDRLRKTPGTEGRAFSFLVRPRRAGMRMRALATVLMLALGLFVVGAANAQVPFFGV
jgi:hypothetical protein